MREYEDIKTHAVYLHLVFLWPKNMCIFFQEEISFEIIYGYMHTSMHINKHIVWDMLHV